MKQPKKKYIFKPRDLPIYAWIAPAVLLYFKFEVGLVLFITMILYSIDQFQRKRAIKEALNDGKEYLQKEYANQAITEFSRIPVEFKDYNTKVLPYLAKAYHLKGDERAVEQINKAYQENPVDDEIKNLYQEIIQSSTQ